MAIVSKSIIAKKIKQEKNLAKTTSTVLTGKVIRTSTVPLLFSSDQEDIVIAGRMNIKIIGKKLKRDLTDACPIIKNDWIKIHPLISKKTETTM
jgi:hypothetical protein